MATSVNVLEFLNSCEINIENLRGVNLISEVVASQYVVKMNYALKVTIFEDGKEILHELTELSNYYQALEIHKKITTLIMNNYGIKWIKMKDMNFKIVARDSLNWAKMPINAKMDNSKSKWNSIIVYREYLDEALGLLQTTIETQKILDIYNESLAKFKQLDTYIYNGNVYAFKMSPSGREFELFKNDKWYMSHQLKERLQSKLFEVFIKSNILDGISIKDSLKGKYQHTKNIGVNYAKA